MTASLQERTPEQLEERLRRQEELEAEGMALGAKEYDERTAKAISRDHGSEAGATWRFLKPSIDALAEVIAEDRRDSAGRRGKPPLWRVYTKFLTPREVAEIVVRAVYDLIRGEPSKPVLVDEIAERLETRLWMDKLKEEAPRLAIYTERTQTGKHHGHLRKVYSAALSFAEVDRSDITLTPEGKTHVGTMFLGMFVRYLKDRDGEDAVLFTYKPVPKYPRPKRGPSFVTTITCSLSPTMQTQMAELEDIGKARSPVLLPMVVEPLPWSTQGEAGGYRFGLRGKFPLITNSDYNRAKLRRKHFQDTLIPTPIVSDALDALQRTAWRINKDVLALVAERRARPDIQVEGFPVKQPAPDKPADIGEDAVSRARHRREKARTLNRNHELSRDIEKCEKTIEVADRVKDEDAIYFPYSLDFRGRCYPIPTRLQPQGSDLERALLTFAEAKPLGPDGADWLAIHGANCLGKIPHIGGDGYEKISKLPLRKRIERIRSDRIEARIRAIAEHPWSDPLWLTADKPLQFYAFCCEWTRYLDSEEGEAFKSSLPVSQDGSCNGLQHYAALLGHVESAQDVNVMPHQVPGYGLIFSGEGTVLPRKRFAGNGGELERQPGVIRVERPVTVDEPQDVYDKIAECVKAKLQDELTATDKPGKLRSSIASDEEIAQVVRARLEARDRLHEAQVAIDNVQKAGFGEEDVRVAKAYLQQCEDAEEVSRQRELDVLRPTLIARWIEASDALIDRDMCKAAAVPFVYGAGQYTCGKAVFEELKKPSNRKAALAHFTIEDEDRSRKAAYVLGPIVHDAIGEVAVAASKGMAWLQEAARAMLPDAVLTGGPDDAPRVLQWVVHRTGFKVVQPYMVELEPRTTNAGRVRQQATRGREAVQLNGYQRDIVEFSDTVKRSKQVASIAPNFVHSLDAAHLMLTILYATKRGDNFGSLQLRKWESPVTAFGAVHDSYATHAGDCTALARATRRVFDQLYDRYTLESVRDQLQATAPDGVELPATPYEAEGFGGDQVASYVVESPYFFS